MRLVFAAILLLVQSLLTPALAESRIALVIGNSKYLHVPQLSNPANDTKIVAASLRQVGFTTVTVLQDLDQNTLKSSLQKFAVAARAADVALIYYAGHGMEMGGSNYLVPVDAVLQTDLDVQYETIPLDLVLASVEGAKRLKLVVLDACRNNPFVPQMRSIGSQRALTRGLARVEPAGDTLLVYAAKAGTTAADGTGTNSPFAEALASNIVEPGLEIGKLFRKVRDDVMAATGNQQEPFQYGSLSAQDFYFVPPQVGAAPSGLLPKQQTSLVGDPITFELKFWDTIKASSNQADFEAYLAQYPNGQFASLAKNRIELLRPPKQASLTARLFDPADFENVLGLNKRSTIDDAVRRLGANSGFDANTRTYSWKAGRGVWLFFVPGKSIAVYCQLAPPLDIDSAVSTLCKASKDRQKALMTNFTEDPSDPGWYYTASYSTVQLSVYVVDYNQGLRGFSVYWY